MNSKVDEWGCDKDVHMKDIKKYRNFGNGIILL